MISTLNTLLTDMVIDDIGVLVTNDVELFACCSEMEHI